MPRQHFHRVTCPDYHYHYHHHHSHRSQKCVIQIYSDLYGDAIYMATRNQQKHLSLSFATKAQMYLSARGTQKR